VFGKIRKWQVRGLVRPWRDKYARDISFLTIQQMVSVVADIAESNALTWRELILDRPVPLLDVGCFPRPVVTDEPQSVRIEVGTRGVGISGSKTVLNCGELAIRIGDRLNIAIRSEEAKIDRPWIVVPWVRRSAEVLEAAVENA